MALRVLLADESTTIKKVMQLALQDFAVEVKAVHAGVDVLDVARSFQPDIIFADVLLQKKNGYEVCGLLKKDPQLKVIPVVLMWSSFMDLDDAQARACGANERLEKPFDVETLRKQVLELVPKTRSQRLAHFLDYSPKLNEELRKAESAHALPPTPEPKVPRAPPPTELPAPVFAAATSPPPTSWSAENFADPSEFAEPDDDESFQPLELSQLHRQAEPPTDDERWARQDLSRFKLDLPPISVGEGHEEFKIDMGEQEFARRDDSHDVSHDDENISFEGPDLILESNEIANAADEVALPIEPLGLEETMPTIPQLSVDRLEEIIRAQSREIIEAVVRKIVPDLASTIIRQELDRLLDETGRDSQV